MATTFGTPDDYQQGSTVKILYIHVPSALMAINAWAMMLVASLIWLIRRHLLGMGPTSNVIPDSVYFLPGLHGPVECCRGHRQSR